MSTAKGGAGAARKAARKTAAAERATTAKRTATSKRTASGKGAASGKRAASGKKGASGGWELRLYVAGQTPNSIAAISNLKRLCEDQLSGSYRIEIIDLLKRPQLAQADQIVAIPTLVRKLPPPIKRIIGDLSRAERALVGLDIKPARSAK